MHPRTLPSKIEVRPSRPELKKLPDKRIKLFYFLEETRKLILKNFEIKMSLKIRFALK